jgi:hypothetical protein
VDYSTRESSVADISIEENFAVLGDRGEFLTVEILIIEDRSPGNVPTSSNFTPITILDLEKELAIYLKHIILSGYMNSLYKKTENL